MTQLQYHQINSPKVNDRIGNCKILSILAEGGMAYIYKAINEDLEAIRVVKLIKSAEDIDLDRFTTEARIGASLNHPNIVQCFNIGRDLKTNLPYIEMEYVDGINLHSLICERKKLPPTIACAIAMQICEALHNVHTHTYILYNIQRKGIVHRDIKPANILISNNGVVKIADFGIAKPKDLTIHTTDFQVVGSPFYLSPEQLKKEPLDFRTDIYSFGCVIYEMVTGKRAFPQNNISDLAIAKCEGKYEKSELEKVPYKFKDVINRCINPRVENRFENTGQLRSIIESLADEMAINNPQKVLASYISNPEAPLFTLSVDDTEKKKFSPLIFSIVSVSFLIIVILGLRYYTKPIEYSSIMPTSKPAQTNQNENTASSTIDSIAIQKPVEQSLTSSSHSLVPQDHTTTPPYSQKNAAMISAPPESMDKKNLPPGPISHFLSGNYAKCVELFSGVPIKNLNDRQYLCYLGSLIETKNYATFETIEKTRHVNEDGYYYYLQARLQFSRHNFKETIDLLQKALNYTSLIAKHQFHSSYYLVKSFHELYLLRPNSENKNNLKQSVEYFLAHNCVTISSPECSEVRTIQDNFK